MTHKTFSVAVNPSGIYAILERYIPAEEVEGIDAFLATFMLTAYLAEFNGNRWEAQISTRDLSIRFTEEWVREPDPPAFVAAMRKFNRDILPELEVMSQEGSLLKLEENPDERIYETGEWFARWCALLAGRLLID